MTLNSTKFLMKSCLYPEYGIGLALIDNIRNPNEIKRCIAQIPAALVKPAMVVDLFQIYCAAQKTIYQIVNDIGFTTKTRFSEFLFNLSGQSQISYAFSKFGIEEGASCCLLVTVGRYENVQKDLDHSLSHIDGELQPLDTLPLYTDCDALCKVYNIDPKELVVRSLCDAVVTRISAKDAHR